jgi:hypothetical protein
MEEKYCSNCKKKERNGKSCLCIDCQKKLDEMQDYFKNLSKANNKPEVKESEVLIKSLRFLDAGLVREISNNFSNFPNGNSRLFIDTLCSILHAANWANKKCAIYDLAVAGNKRIHEILKEMGFTVSIRYSPSDPPLLITWE